MLSLERRRFRVRGVVQGVGFRPFVYRLAQRHALAGFVLNDGDGVVQDDGLRQGRDPSEIAARFHETIAAGAAAACAGAALSETVVLSGGTVQNLRLLEATRRRLEALGFRVLSHRLGPPNDGGISYGQAAVAARRLAQQCA